MDAKQIIEVLLSIKLDFEERVLACKIEEALSEMDCEIGHLIIAAKYLFAEAS